MTTDPPPPRRKWHFTRWLIILIIATFGWSGWRAYAFRSALAEAKALGWAVEYTDPAEEIRKSWKAAFKNETWMDGVTFVYILTSERFERHLAIVRRLNPRELHVYDASTLRDLSALRPFTRLEVVSLEDCTGLTNVDGLKNLTALQVVNLSGWTRLTNVDGLKNLSALQGVYLRGCMGLTNLNALKNLSSLREIDIDGCTGLTSESVAALRAALPNARITDP